MKKILLIAICILISACTFTKEQKRKAHKLIKDYLNKHLNDAHSYESVEFGKMDTVKSNFTQSPEYDLIEDSLTSVQTKISEANLNLEYPDLYNSKRERSLIKKLTKDSTFYMAKKDSLEKNFNEKQIGWYITHTYRAKNGFGALGIHESGFTFNMACDSIIDVTDSKH